MKKFLLSLLGCAVLLGGCSKGDAGDKGPQPLKPLEEVADVTTKMPDARFAKYCLDNFDVDMDGVLSMAEAAEVTMIRLPNGSGDSGESLNLISLSGIEYFTNLTMLVCSKNLLTELDLSYNQKLEFLDCADNQITELDLSRISTLENVYCERNKLNVLTIPPSAKYLETLWCENNQLPALDVRNLTNLEDLDCSANKLSSLDLTGCLRLVYLNCNSNSLKTLNIPNGQLLEELDCSFNEFSTLDLLNCPVLKEIQCQYNNNLTVLWLNWNLWSAYTQDQMTLNKDRQTNIWWEGGHYMAIDGDFSDWKEYFYQVFETSFPTSRPANAEYRGLDQMWVMSDAENIYFYIEYEPFLQDRTLTIYLDSDLNASTGSSKSYWNSCGAEYLIKAPIYGTDNSNPGSFDASIYDWDQSQTIVEEGSGNIIGSHPCVLDFDQNMAVEFSIKRSVFPSLGSSIRIGAYLYCYDPDYEGLLPQGESSSWSNYVKTEMLTVDLE